VAGVPGSHKQPIGAEGPKVVKRLHHWNPGIVTHRVYGWRKERVEIVDMNDIRSKLSNRLRHRSNANRIADRTNYRKHLIKR
jgi:hypothetical protein